MNILLINHYAGSPIHGMEYRPYYLAREWVCLGHNVLIAAASFSHLRSQTPTIYANVTEEEMDGIRYIWLKTPPYQGNGIRRVLNMVKFLEQLFSKNSRIIKQAKPDVVIASSTYPLDIYPAYRIAKRTKAKLIFEVHDLWPLSPIELGGMSPWHPFIMVMQQAENFAYRNADYIVSLLPKADSYMREHGMAAHKFVYIPNGIDVEEWQCNSQDLPEQHKQELIRLKREGLFMVGYAGSHGISNALHTFVDAAAILHKQPIALVLVGQGPEKEKLQFKAEELGLKKVAFLPPVPKGSIPQLLDLMDALYIGWKRNRLYRFGVSPNKLMDYMMAGKPVVHAIEAGNDLVSESGCGISVPPENPKAVADAIRKISQMSEGERRDMGSRGHYFIQSHHDYRILAREFLGSISEKH